jgi:sugar lactone lactonase YvrE
MGPQSSTLPVRAVCSRGGDSRTRAKRVAGTLVRHSVGPRALALVGLACLFSAGALLGQASQLPLVLPSAIAFDAKGNLYVADVGAHVVREISSAGVVSIVAGTSVQGFAGDDGMAAAARLDSPMGLAADASGNLYISDTHNQRIRKVAAGTSIITTIAGTGTAGFSGDGGPAKSATLNRPTALAADGTGNVYAADTGNHRIRKIAADGTISTVAGRGAQGFSGDNAAATNASLDSPYGIAVDASGNLFIADSHNGRIRRVAASTGVITTFAGNGSLGSAGDGGAGTSAALALPRGVHVDATGDVYLADTANHRIRRISPAGTINTIAGGAAEGFSGDGSAPTGATLDSPNSIAVSPAGLVTLSDAGNRRVRQIDLASADIESLPRLASPASPALILSGPATLTYGTGTFTAKLTGVAAQAQTVMMEDVVTGTAVSLGSTVLDATGSATWTSASLTAGTHVLVATCSGVASIPLTVDVRPVALTATAAGASILYGQAVPALSGVLAGVLPQDASGVSSIWSTTAGLLSSPGTYPVSATLSGPSESNYTLASVTGSVTIAKAPATVSLAVSANSLVPGIQLVLTPHVASTTSGVPTGTVSLMDGSSSLGTVQVGTTFTATGLASGTHGITAVYAGDANFLPASSSAVIVTVAAPVSDFTLASSGPSTQTVATGTAATFQFNVTMQGASLSSPILLAVQGIPAGATASVNPVSVPPGSTSTTFTLTVQTPKAANSYPGAHPAVWWALLLIPPGMWKLRRTRRIRLTIFSGSCILLGLLAAGCGDRMNTSSSQSHISTYTITVTGTATGPSGSALQHSAVVTLEVY